MATVQDRVDNYYENGGSTSSNNGGLFWNPETGQFDVAPANGGSERTGGANLGDSNVSNGGSSQKAHVMIVTAREGHFMASSGGLEWDPVTGQFVNPSASTPAAASPSQSTQPVQAEVVPDTPGNMYLNQSQGQPQHAAVMMVVAREGHFSANAGLSQEVLAMPRIDRLTAEFKILSQIFNKGHAKLHQLTERRVMLSYKGRFGLTLDIPQNYPTEMPKIYVSHPKDLKKKDGSRFAGASHADHTWGTSAEFGTQVCHGDQWKPQNSLASVIFKAFMWIDAYEKHLHSGRDINSYLCDSQEVRRQRQGS